MGLLPSDDVKFEADHLKNYLTVYPENEMIRTLVKSFMERNSSNIVHLS